MHIKKRFENFIELMKRMNELNKNLNQGKLKYSFRIYHKLKELRHGGF